MTRLDELPREILINIASFCDCPDVFSLELTNRVFHSIVNDWQVYSRLLERQWLAEVGSELYPRTPVTASDSINLWKRYALANWKSAAPQDGFQLRLDEWAPMLITQHHPMIDYFRMEAFRDLLEYYYQNMSDANRPKFVALAFSYAALRLQDPADARSAPGWMQSLKGPRFVPPIDNDLLNEERRKIGFSMTYEPLFSVEEVTDFASGLIDMPLSKYADAYLALARFVTHVCAAQLRPSWTVRAPRSADIPYTQVMTMPSPFPRTQELQQLGLCHVDRMVTKQFLVDGEWVGCYSYNAGWPRMDPPMQGITFQADGPHTGDGGRDYLRVSADGQDAIGNFSLHGRIYNHNGLIVMRKQYVGGQGWRWAALITPLGIFGTWDDGTNLTMGGWVWLWKKSWVE